VTTIRDALPPVYRGILGDAFDRPKPSERRATCADCAMCDHGAPSPVKMDYFRLDTKCCTFFPRLPNYLAGAILSDPETAEGARRLRARIATRIGVTPRWLTRPRKLELVMAHYGEAFGRAKSLLCPYFDDGLCSVWKHRDAVCLTYHCKYEGGQRGFDFWTALRRYLQFVEERLSWHAARSVDATLEEPKYDRPLSVEDIEDLPPKGYARFWGAWVGREEEFYRRCHEWVSSVPRAELAQNLDATAEGKHLLDALVSAEHGLAHRTLPLHAVKNPRMTEVHVGDKVVVTTYHRYDSFALEKALYDVLDRFRPDQTLEASLAGLKAEGIELVPELVDFLVTTGVLVAPGEGPPRIGLTDDRPGRRAALLAILDARGIALDDDLTERVRVAGAAALDTWIRRAALAQNVGDVFDPA